MILTTENYSDDPVGKGRGGRGILPRLWESQDGAKAIGLGLPDNDFWSDQSGVTMLPGTATANRERGEEGGAAARSLGSTQLGGGEGEKLNDSVRRLDEIFFGFA